MQPLPSPSALSKSVLHILKFFKHAQFFYVYSKSFWYTQKLDLPSPSAFSKFVLSALKFLGILKVLRCTQNSFGILK